MVLSGHKHVPYVWDLNNVKLITSGTAGTMRIRGNILPAINFIEISDETIDITILSSNDKKSHFSYKR